MEKSAGPSAEKGNDQTLPVSGTQEAIPGKAVPEKADSEGNLSATSTAEKSTTEEAAIEEKPKKDKPEYLRVVYDAQHTPVAMETAIVRFRPIDPKQKGPTVDLVAAVHIAERSYYQEINREFAGYDAVLYELVAPEGTRVPRGGVKSGGSALSTLQNAMKDLLELKFQLNEVDYTRKNLVHADMSPEQFTKSMDERGESFVAMFLRMMGYAMARQQSGGGTSDTQLLLAFFDKNRALAMKRVMAEEFCDLEGSTAAIDGPKGSTLIGERNKAALKVLSEQIAAGKQTMAIFYGAAHMPDFQRRLRDDFGLAPVSTRWLVAWKMGSANPKPPAPASDANATPPPAVAQ